MHYTIRSGDTLSRIAATHRTSLQVLCDCTVLGERLGLSLGRGRQQARSVREQGGFRIADRSHLPS
jgi:hypothetical protein